MSITKIISGGQAGVDRAALDAAIAIGVPHGGWCPRGRLAEDGPIDPRYGLQETESAGYRQRTRLNVIESAGTLILNEGPLSGGTALTQDFARRFGKPHFLIQLDEERPEVAAYRLLQWLGERDAGVLNVAGPGERKRPGIHGRALGFMVSVLESCARLALDATSSDLRSAGSGILRNAKEGCRSATAVEASSGDAEGVSISGRPSSFE